MKFSTVLLATALAFAPAAYAAPKTDLIVGMAAQDVGRLDPHLAVSTIDRAVVAEPSEPTAEGTARVVLIGRHPPRQLDPDALAKLIGRRGIQAVSRAPEPHKGIVALEEFAPGGVVPQRRNPLEQLGIG